jgi:type II secretory pathway component PulC
LANEPVKAFTLPPATQITRPNVFLTGITRLNGVRKVHLVLKNAGQPDKFISLATNEKQYEVELKKIYKNSALISNNGSRQLMSFKNNGLPTIIQKLPAIKKTSSSKDKKEEKKSSKTTKLASPSPNIVKVPSRRPKVDPRIIQKGLEYIDRIEDKEKKEYILKRLERLQSGQDSIKRDVKDNEIRRQYDERRKRDK